MRNATPLLPLRSGKRRSVSNCVWTQTLLLESEGTQTMVNHLRALPCPSKAGELQDLDIYDMRFVRHSVLPALDKLVRQVSSALQSAGFLVDGAVMEERALMFARGVQPHYDGGTVRWRNALFWTVCLDQTDTDVVFGNLDLRVPQHRGVLMVFDPYQPHCVMAREHAEFMKSDFGRGRIQYFAGGSFQPIDWSAWGVDHDLCETKMKNQADILFMLVDQKTCQVKRGRAS